MIKFLQLVAVVAVLATTFSCTPQELVENQVEQSTDGEKGGDPEDPDGII